MKKIAPLVLAATLTLSSFSEDRLNENLGPAEATARGIIYALRQSSEERFISMFPELSEFLELMEKNEAFYGLNLEPAKADFEKTYNEELMPAVRCAYGNLVAETERRSINWSEVNLHSVNIPGEATGLSSIKITFEQDGKKFDLLIERSLMIDGKWKISQYVSFID